MVDETLDSILRQLHDPDGPEVIRIGNIPIGCLAYWSVRSTDEVLITRERRIHYLANHPEMHQIEYHLVSGIADPDEIHINKSDSNIAIVYARLRETHWLRIAIIVSQNLDLKNSVVSCRLARSKEVLEGRKANRLVWAKR